jgi:hypothetical protein
MSLNELHHGLLQSQRKFRLKTHHIVSTFDDLLQTRLHQKRPYRTTSSPQELAPVKKPQIEQVSQDSFWECCAHSVQAPPAAKHRSSLSGPLQTSTNEVQSFRFPQSFVATALHATGLWKNCAKEGAGLGRNQSAAIDETS